MATAKAKTVSKTGVKKSAKAKPKPKMAAKKAAPKVQVKVTAKVKAQPKVAAKAPPVKAVAHKPRAVHKHVPQKTVPPKNESVFARLLREKAERHQQYQKQHENQHQPHDSSRMPHNHASFSKFAGPRRRAS